MKKTLAALTVILAILNIFALFTCVGAQEGSDDAVEQIARDTKGTSGQGDTIVRQSAK